ncbi:hypothetical protein [Candidatus Xianfuyuplasma coldseepsis]|uniref:HTH cro/C1-type domain-containing protein n=1 Tax=Candidatus Xianfuyuplasma coldseepsis TaxID=2782163 RepID=A0A7L7KQF3_9MOLU|nr:hypothetical protein [Xianfuyuplasma coldseepsis]QMS84512.1 hypothetical protein G4Z02_01695 [Xianfuyuplasma coldseepsis]
MTAELSNYVNTIRKQKKISIETLTDGIISSRQYKRYLSGDSVIPFRVFNELCERLMVNPINVLQDLEQTKQNEQELLDQLYSDIIHLNLDDAKTVIEKLSIIGFTSEGHTLYFQICFSLYQYYTKQEEISVLRKHLETLLSYPSILEQSYFSSNELLGIGVLMTYLPKQERKPILDKLQLVLKGDVNVLGKHFRMQQYIFVKIAKELGVLGDFTHVLEICTKGIENAFRHHSTFNLDYFYYYSALAHHYLAHEDNRDFYLNRLYLILQVIGNEHKFDKFNKLVYSDFGRLLESFQQ